jgi:hypothetical protein
MVRRASVAAAASMTKRPGEAKRFAGPFCFFRDPRREHGTCGMCVCSGRSWHPQRSPASTGLKARPCFARLSR